MPAPQPTKRLRISNGERYEVVVDFAKFPPGKRIVLRNVSPKNNEDFTHSALVMAFDVIGDSFDPAGNSVPAVLRPDNPVMTVPESSAVATRTLRLHRSNGLWQINDTTWDDIVASGYKRVEARPANGSTEIWEFRNTSGGWFHPMHLHLADFRMLTRNGAPVHPYERGPKDVAYLGENEVIRVLLHFEGSGNYMLHCHNAVHEDHDMMTQFEVVDSSGPGPSPLSAPAVPIGTLPPL